MAQIQTTQGFPTYTWWTVVFYFFLIPGVFVVVASDTIQTYHVALVGYMACGLVLTTSSVNGLVYSTNGAKEAAAAGFILLSMVTVSCLVASSFWGGMLIVMEIPTDRLDLLLRIRALGHAPRLPGLVRLEQGVD